jgi:hypothetical protein
MLGMDLGVGAIAGDGSFCCPREAGHGLAEVLV